MIHSQAQATLFKCELLFCEDQHSYLRRKGGVGNGWEEMEKTKFNSTTPQLKNILLSYVSAKN